MACAHRLLAALLITACAPAPRPSLRATQGPTSRPCPACAADERCDVGACVPVRIVARPVPPPRDMTAVQAGFVAREQAREQARRRIKGSRLTLIVGAGVTLTGAIVFAAIAAAGAPKSRYDDGNDGFEFLYGALPLAAGGLTMIVSAPILIDSRNRLRALAEPRGLTLGLRPSLAVGARSGHAGLVLDLRF